MPVMYPFTGVMIGGDIDAPTPDRFADLDENFPEDAEIRVQLGGTRLANTQDRCYTTDAWTTLGPS